MAGAVTGLVSTTRLTATAFARLARVHVLVVILLCGALVWTWDQDHCGNEDRPDSCVRPVAGWLENLP